MLKGIPPVLSPDLLKVLCEMGHGDVLVIADGNFPAESVGKDWNVIRMDGHSVPDILEAVLSVFPLDRYVEQPVHLMKVVEGDQTEVPIWEDYKRIIMQKEELGEEATGYLERFDFYREAKKAYALIATGEKALYANIMLQKGVVK
ncbi:RbsD/FucU family protein [Lacrimispora celerecrescens]|uniref:L-fucose mutarotase n=1 Tax=[Clostridium] celerecrescens 18A TaxID=1286362 RepID=A0A2M8Z5I8_9FIRM|nr:RbsD/FucU domain-containing protein [Lacrimispora celerecrescens]PJJ28712.1 L-fucose mutarotase [[Clostridium] celerecrescens 18A]